MLQRYAMFIFGAARLVRRLHIQCALSINTSFVCKQFWKLSLAYIDKTVSINVKQFHIFMMLLLFEMCG